MTAPSLGAVLATRQGSLLLALLCALMAAVVLVFALSRFKANVAKPIPQATVLVSTGEIQSGMDGAQIAARGLYKAMPVAVDQVSSGAIDNAAQIASATASTDILPGQQLTSSDFATISDVGQALKHGQRAVEIATSGATGATDITQPGSRVDLYAKVGAYERVIASDVLVLKPATATPVEIGNHSVAGSTLVLALAGSEVPTVIQNASDLYLVLRPSSTGNQADSTPLKAAPAAAGSTTTTTGAQ